MDETDPGAHSFPTVPEVSPVRVQEATPIQSDRPLMQEVPPPQAPPTVGEHMFHQRVCNRGYKGHSPAHGRPLIDQWEMYYDGPNRFYSDNLARHLCLVFYYSSFSGVTILAFA